jgi:hypothetical protein
MKNTGEIYPVWRTVSLSTLFALRSWYYYLGESAEAFNLLLKPNAFAFTGRTSIWFQLLHPPLWLAIGLGLFGARMYFARSKLGDLQTHLNRGWIILPFLLLSGWLVAPSDFGAAHGSFLRMRLLLFALMSMIPVLKLNSRHVCVWLGAAVLLVAVVLQSAFVWDYALTSNRIASIFMAATPAVGTGKRIGTLQLDLPRRFSMPLLPHIDSMLGIGTGNIVWHNYEANQYYFPVIYRNALGRYLGQELSRLETIDLTSFNAVSHITRWTDLLTAYHDAIDTLVVWGVDQRLDALHTRWYDPEPVFQEEELRVFQHR